MKKINEEKIIKYLRSLILRSLTVIVIFLLLAIICKSNKEYKDVRKSLKTLLLNQVKKIEGERPTILPCLYAKHK